MKKVIIFLEASDTAPGLQSLKNDFQAHQIAIESVLSADWEKGSEDTLLITDCHESIKKASQAGITCVGYEAAGSESFIPGADMVIQGFEELNTDFFELIFQHSHGQPWTIDRTERLIIRETVIEDFEALFDLYQDKSITYYMPAIESREEMAHYIQNMYKFYHYGLWTVIEAASGQIIGRVGLDNQMYNGEMVIELGYMIGAPYQRNGYGKEAARASMNYAFEVVGIKELYVFVHQENTASCRLANHLGFAPVSVKQGEKPDNVQVFKKCR